MIDKIKTFVSGLFSNRKFVETVKIFVIYGCLLAPVNFIVNTLFSSFKLSNHYSFFSIMGLITSFIDGIIASALAGIVFYFLYEIVRNWIKRSAFLSRHVNSVYTLFWKPFLYITIITSLFSLISIVGLGAIVTAFTGPYGLFASLGVLAVWAVYTAIQIAIYYFYSKEISAKLVKFYVW
jgi:uncharacterized membrane protein